MVSGNTDLGSNLSSMFSTASLSRDSAQLFEPETLGNTQGEGELTAESCSYQEKFAFGGGEGGKAEL